MLKKKMSRAVKGLTAMILAAVCIANTGVTAYAANTYRGDYYGLDLNYHESAKCEKADGWSNGDMFGNCTWRSGNVNFNNGKTYFINSKLNSKCLDIAYWSKDAGANIQQWNKNGGAQQQWKIEPVGDAFCIINVNSGKALEIADGSWENSENIQQWDYYGGSNQLWYFTKLN